MKFSELLRIVGGEPVFETGLLLAGDVDPADVRRQLVRWTNAGKIIRLRRGLYAPASPYVVVKPHPFVVANRLLRPSYVSLESALALHGLIPEYVPVTTSVTTRRPGVFDTPFGSHSYRCLKMSMFWGYRAIDLPDGQQALVAGPEKALLDLLHLRARSDSPGFLRELRLQNLERLDLTELSRQAERIGAAKVRRAAAAVTELATAQAKEFDTL